MFRIFLMITILFLVHNSASAADKKVYVVCWHTFVNGEKNSPTFFAINSPQKANLEDIKAAENGAQKHLYVYRIWLSQKVGFAGGEYQYYEDRKQAKNLYDELLKKARENRNKIVRTSVPLTGFFTLNGKTYKFR